MRGPARLIIAGSRSVRQLRQTDRMRVLRSSALDLREWRHRKASAPRPSWQLGLRVSSRAAACGQLQNPWTSPIGIGGGTTLLGTCPPIPHLPTGATTTAGFCFPSAQIPSSSSRRSVPTWVITPCGDGPTTDVLPHGGGSKGLLLLLLIPIRRHRCGQVHKRWASPSCRSHISGAVDGLVHGLCSCPQHSRLTAGLSVAGCHWGETPPPRARGRSRLAARPGVCPAAPFSRS